MGRFFPVPIIIIIIINTRQSSTYNLSSLHLDKDCRAREAEGSKVDCYLSFFSLSGRWSGRPIRSEQIDRERTKERDERGEKRRETITLV